MKPKYGEFYYYIEDGKVLRRRYTMQDVDIQNAMMGNYYLTEEKARLDLQYMRVSRRGKK